MKTIHFANKRMSYVVFTDGSQAQEALMDMTRSGIKIKAGELMVIENDGRVSESISKEKFEEKYGLPTMRVGT